MPTVAFLTLGCKQNQFDTQALNHHLCKDTLSQQDGGVRLARRTEEADWIVLNTCAVTQRALAKARGEIHKLQRLNPRAKIIAVGCGVRYTPEVFTAEGCLTAEDPSFKTLGLFDPGLDLAPPHGFIPRGKTRGFLRVQTGCDQSCAYCIVPSLRGLSRSVSLDDCLLTLQTLVAEGAPEVVLTGTNIALWGRDLPGKPDLQELMAAMVRRVSPARLRLSSLEPHLITPDFIGWCLDQPNICRHLHFAFQSGSARVLVLMQRREPAIGLVAHLREMARRHPDFCLGTDLITGFPGETEEDFEKTVNWIRSVPFSYLHVFPYSERVGTPAMNHTHSLPTRERLHRAAILRQLSGELKDAFIQHCRDSIQDVVLIKNTVNKEVLASNYLRITFQSKFTAPASRFNVNLSDHAVASIHMQK
jgi:threonylcarbamoyladenosine tRNA methylthiotransferase MtaB